MAKSLIQLPTGFNWRELWDFRNYSGSIVMPMVPGGHKLTATGARKGTTTDGVVFYGTATSNMVVTADAVLNNQAKFAVTIRFKRNTTFAAGAAADEYLLNKVVGGAYIRVRLESTDGKLYWEGADGLGGTFSLTSTTVSWTAGTWYIVTLSLSDTGPAQRLLVNGSLEDSDTSVAFNTPNGGDLIIASSSDGGTDGFQGTISYVGIVTDALTANEEGDFNRGIAPSDVVNLYALDEGEGATCNDRGSGADNATLDAACRWSYSGTTKSAASLDGVNDYFTSDVGVDISGAYSLVWAGKLKLNDNGLVTSNISVFFGWSDANNYFHFLHSVGAYFTFTHRGTGTGIDAVDNAYTSIDEYAVFVGTFSTPTATLYKNGSLRQATGGGVLASGAASTLYIGATATPNSWSPNKPSVIGIVNGALSATQVLQLSRAINQRYGLGLSI